MKKSILAVAVLALAFIAGCKKDEDDDKNSTPLTPRLITTFSDSVGVTTWYEFTPSGKLSRIYNSTGAFAQTYHYNGTTVLLEHIKFEQVDSTTIFYLNPQGLAYKGVTRLPNNVAIRKIEFVYDANGYMTSASWYNPTDSIPFITRNVTINGGNAVKLSDVTSDSLTAGIPVAEYTFGFYGDKTSSIGPTNIGLDFLGKSNTNPEKDMTIAVGGVTVATSTYNYTYDDQGRVSSKVCYNDYQGGAGAIRGDSITYTYQLQ